MANKGWGAVRTQVNKARNGRGVGRFFIKDGESRKIQFIETDPFCIYEHTLQVDGKWKSITCLQGSGEECPICEDGNTARFVGKFTVIDFSEEKEQWRIKVYTQGIRVLKQLERLAKKEKGLNGYVFEVSRTGGGVDTAYNFDTVEERELTSEEKKKAQDFSKSVKPLNRKQVLNLLGESVDDEDVNDGDNDDIVF